MARTTQYTIHMLLPSLRNTQYQRGHNPHNDVPSFWSPCGLVCLTEDSSATFGGIHQSKGNQYVLIEMVKGRAWENAECAHSENENYPTLAFDDKIILRHVKDVRPASLCLSLISSFAYEVLGWLTRLLPILQNLWGEGMRLLFLFLQVYIRGQFVKVIRHALSCRQRHSYFVGAECEFIAWYQKFC